jgi:penicillin-binding protein 1C
LKKQKTVYYLYNFQLHFSQLLDLLFHTRIARRVYALVGLPFVVFLLLNLIFPLPAEPPYAQIITTENGTVLSAFLSADEKWRMKTILPEITPELQKAFIAKEDKYFYYHLGINPLAIFRAAFNNLLRGKKTSGASTITMQVARLLEPKKRTYSNKIVEVFRALQLEWKYSKAEILQLYLNLVPYGGNIEGVKAASLLYFSCLPNQLSVAQITALSIIPNRPTSLALGKHNDKIEEERNRWLKIFESEKVFSKTVIADALLEPIKAKRHKSPKTAIHFAYLLHRLYPQTDIVPSYIKIDLQNKVEEITQAYMRSIGHYGVHNAAVLVIENETQRVLAYLGSPNFEDAAYGGQVDGVRAYRSPGSALKPLVYGLAFDAGKITPKLQLLDVSQDFEGYMPENYNKRFNGLVTAEKALAASLNLPAVSLLNEIGVKTLTDKLKVADFQWIGKQEKNVGLSLALGGCGVNLFEMAGLYTAFANEGKYKPLQISPLAKNLLGSSKPLTNLKEGKEKLKQDKAKEDKILLSPAANYVINEILTKVERPLELPSSYENNPHLPKIAWKTGTSYGRRDAWSIGFNKKYTVAVWVGNFNGEGRPELTGAGVATPLLFKLFNNIDYKSAYQWFEMPKELDFRLVCAASGKVPNSFCDNITSDYYLSGVSSAQPCDHLKHFFVSPDEKMSYCTKCLPDNNYKQKLYPNLPPEMVLFYEQNLLSYEKIPTHNPACTQLFDGLSPVIISPANNREFFTDNEKVELLLQAKVQNDVKKLYWYVDNQFYKAVLPSAKLFFKPERGRIKISCSDDKGRNHDVWIWVR